MKNNAQRRLHGLRFYKYHDGNTCSEFLVSTLKAKSEIETLCSKKQLKNIYMSSILISHSIFCVKTSNMFKNCKLPRKRSISFFATLSADLTEYSNEETLGSFGKKKISNFLATLYNLPTDKKTPAQNYLADTMSENTVVLQLLEIAMQHPFLFKKYQI